MERYTQPVRNTVPPQKTVEPVYVRPIVVREPMVEEPKVYREPIVEERVRYREPIVDDRALYREPIMDDRARYREPIVEERVRYREPIMDDRERFREPIMDDRERFREPIMDDRERFREPIMDDRERFRERLVDEPIFDEPIHLPHDGEVFLDDQMGCGCDHEKYREEFDGLRQELGRLEWIIDHNRKSELVRNIDHCYICPRRRKVVVKLKLKTHKHISFFKQKIKASARIVVE